MFSQKSGKGNDVLILPIHCRSINEELSIGLSLTEMCSSFISNLTCHAVTVLGHSMIGPIVLSENCYTRKSQAEREA
uniref:Uncharacterized protein n=1 Tax=Onchocerca volvulus TaxID=6282 RepID=A0A8R1Y0H4_ONCVO